MDIIGRRRVGLIAAFASPGVAPSFADSAGSQVVDRELRSENFAHNNVGTDPVRKMAVYLPAGYDGSSQRYPVIYFLPSPFDGFRGPFDRKGAQGLFDRLLRVGEGAVGVWIVGCPHAGVGAEDENSNAQAVLHAMTVRKLTELRGGPCVVMLCHPTKRAADDDLIPRGGGALLAELDGNIACRKADGVVGLEDAVLHRVAVDDRARVERAVVADRDQRALGDAAAVVERAAADADADQAPDHALERGAVERAGLRELREGQKVGFEVVVDRKTGKSAAENLKTV